MNNKKYFLAFIIFVTAFCITTNLNAQRRNKAPLIRFGVRAGFNMSDLTSTNGLDVWNGLAFYNEDLKYVGIKDTKPFKYGFNLGLTAQVKINDHFFWQPSLLFMSKGYKVATKYTENYREYNLDIDAGAYYFQLPIDFLYKYELSDNFRLIAQAGAFVGVGAFGYTDFEDHYGEDTVPRQNHYQVNRPGYNSIIDDIVMVAVDPTVHGSHLYWKDKDDTFIPEGTWRFDAGLQFGLGFEWRSFQFMIQYQLSLTPLYNYNTDYTYRYEEKGINGIRDAFQYLDVKKPSSPHHQVISINISYYFDNLKTSKAIRW
ncbi:MAG: PorT family protein [Bacteroidales bacterium]|jgi:hypothetical protein|nr:PorT family protein [Bacteroidales bacterium]